MDITKENLKTISLRGSNLAEHTNYEKIIHRCLRSAINGFDCVAFPYDEHNEKEVRQMENIKQKLIQKGFWARFDGDENDMKLFVTWS